MNNNLDDDFTPEEKALLKREAQYRIEQQRAREESPTIAIVFFGGISLLLKIFAYRTSAPWPTVMDVVGNVFLMVTAVILIIALIATVLKRK